ncbi:M3 family metallopeptidase [Parvularcula dongshanensis]|uniref:Peptidyl-dipeptidase Dcp n=1 Tax=Parvularcula dongshanensis TaxID=1173995 RepID=A0A840I662_9PROT|nr:M3 family metallopeptidase [Parvularcula dongshanensis]MBB4659674.1 peptidyl-dipeptidase Dcp [Parvularcula dongshanensis]
MRNALLLGAALMALTACGAVESSMDANAQEANQTDAATPEANPDTALTAPFKGPYGGVPAFDQVRLEDFEPALLAAVDEGLAEIDEITGNDAAPTFENTILAMEEQGGALDRFGTYYGIWSSNLSSPEFQEIETALVPIFSDYEATITANEALFERIKTVYEDEDQMAALSAEEQRLVWDYYTDFERSGAALDAETKAKIADLNERLNHLYTKFSQNLLHDEGAYVTYVSEDQLGGLPDDLVQAMAQAAEAKGREGEYAVTNTRSSMDPFLTYSNERGLREQVWRTYYDRGDNGDEYDNNELISEILRLREERSHLQGYDTFADRALEKQVAKTPEAAMDLMMRVWPAAKARVAEEVADMQAVADAEGADIEIAPWDYRYYAEKVRKQKYDLDANEVKQYLQLENLREGMFWMAGELYGLTFKGPIDTVPVYHDDVRVWEVYKDGKLHGLWYFDPYAREGKRSGAWMNAYRTQDKLGGQETMPIVSNNANFVKGAPGEPVLVSWDDAETMFHEFGHAIHGLMSDVTYPSLAGTAVPRDYVEFPSQVHENWLATPQVLQQYALNVDTGEPIPQELVAKIKKASTFNQGFATTEYLASALVDMKLHTLKDASNVDPDAFEKETLEELGMPDELPMRHRTPQFAHIFSGEGYAAGYYAYLWADTFGADAWEAFAEAPGGAYDQDVAQRFIDHVLSVGNTVDPIEGYAAFRGHEVDVNALMRQRGFPTDAVVPAESAGSQGLDSAGDLD